MQWTGRVRKKLSIRNRAHLFMAIVVAGSIGGCGRLGFDAITDSEAVANSDGGTQTRDASQSFDGSMAFDTGTPDASDSGSVVGDTGMADPDVGMPDSGTTDSGPLDAGTDAGSTLSVTTTTTEITVNSPGNFEIVFVAAQLWQPTRWSDFTTTGTANLAGLVNSQRKFQVLASPIGILTGVSWLTLNESDTSSATAMQLGPGEVLVTTNFRIAGNVVWNARVDYLVRDTRRIEATVTITAPTATAIDGFEFAYTNVDPTYGWDTTIASDSQSFRLAATAGSAPLPTLTARAIPPTVATRVETDTVGNRYFQTDATLSVSPGSPFVVTWELEF